MVSIYNFWDSWKDQVVEIVFFLATSLEGLLLKHDTLKLQPADGFVPSGGVKHAGTTILRYLHNPV